MNDDVMRLSDLVPEYARHYKVSPPDAAYALHELFTELNTDHQSKQPNKSIPNNIVWVGKVGGSMRSTKAYKIYFSGLVEYFNALIEQGCNSEFNLVRCLYVGTHSDTKDIPPSMVYLSRSLLSDLVSSTSIELPGFLLNEAPEVARYKPGKEETKAFQGKELVSIQGLARGLIEIIIEVDKAHRGLSKKTNPAAILLAASQLDLNKRPSKWRAVLADLAAAAEVEDFRGNRRTLEKYVGD